VREESRGLDLCNDDLQPGKILVAECRTPLFINDGCLVLEVVEALPPSAAVVKEYGIPAAVG